MAQQKTIDRNFIVEGKGLQTGKPVKVFFYPEKENEGIVFIRKDLKDKPPIRLSDYGSLIFKADRRSIVGRDEENYVETVEHVMAALWGAEIDNLRIELDSSELPALDGSAKKFLEAFKKAGIKKQKAVRESIDIKEPVWVEEKESFLGVFPSEIFKVSYIFEHPYPGVGSPRGARLSAKPREAAGRQAFSEAMTPNLFEREIAPARTLWLVPQGEGSVEEKAERVKQQGYGRGADLENTLVINEKGPVNSPMFPDEPARHGVLDLIGDLYLLNRPIKGRLIAIRSGHRLNLELIRKISKVIN